MLVIDYSIVDNDGDGYGTSLSFMLDCEILDGYSELEGDCNDTSVEQNPMQQKSVMM